MFLSSTFRDMQDERAELMTHVWPELRRFCRDRGVDLVEVDLRWGITEEQGRNEETLKICLGEVEACRPLFVALLGERYGWAPPATAFSADLREAHPWLSGAIGQSLTELEIRCGVLNAADRPRRALFYFRDPRQARLRGADFLAESAEAAHRQAALKEAIRAACAGGGAGQEMVLREGYGDPKALAAMVLDDLRRAIAPELAATGGGAAHADDRLHEAVARSHQRAFVGRDDLLDRLDRHAGEHDDRTGRGPIALVAESGQGKSALLANWAARWRARHPQDLVYQHYLGAGGQDGGAEGEHFLLLRRLVSHVKRWCDDPTDVPADREALQRDLPAWLAKAKSHARRSNTRCVFVIDALDQLPDPELAQCLGWLAAFPFTAPARLIVSATPGAAAAAIERAGWPAIATAGLDAGERGRMIDEHLALFGKSIDRERRDRVARAPASESPLFLRTLLDELRVTGTHDGLDQRLDDYLRASTAGELLAIIFARYRRDYDRDRPGLCQDALASLWAARRGLSEPELLRALRSPSEPQMPHAWWAPLRAAIDESLLVRDGVMTFAHSAWRLAVESMFAGTGERRVMVRTRLADDFEAAPPAPRSCDELPWLLRQIGDRARLRRCLLDLDRFVEIQRRSEDEAVRYWGWLGEERALAQPYLEAFERWRGAGSPDEARLSVVATDLASFLKATAFPTAAEGLYRLALDVDEKAHGTDAAAVADSANNLATVLYDQGRNLDAEPLLRRVLSIRQSAPSDGRMVAIALNNLAAVRKAMGDFDGAEPLYREALAAVERGLGPHHVMVAVCANNLASLLQDRGRLSEAEPLYSRALSVDLRRFGPDHPQLAADLTNLATLMRDTDRLDEARPLAKRAVGIEKETYGARHPNVARALNNLAEIDRVAKRYDDAEPLFRLAIEINDACFETAHPTTATYANNLGLLLQATGRFADGERAYQRALAVVEACPAIPPATAATYANNYALLLDEAGRPAEAERWYGKALDLVERGPDPEGAVAAACWYNLGLLRVEAGDLKRGVPLVRRALVLFRRVARRAGGDDARVAAVARSYRQLRGRLRLRRREGPG